MVTRGLFPRLGLDHCIRSELSPEQEQGGSRRCAGIPRAMHFMAHTMAHTSLSRAHTGHGNTREAC